MFLNFETMLCYEMYAAFLIDNSIDMTLENFTYTETNMVQDFNIFVFKGIHLTTRVENES